MRIAVIGAGPAGSTAAAGLARLGHDVTLYDRSFDREKPCGGGVPAAGLARLFAAADRAMTAGSHPGDARTSAPAARPSRARPGGDTAARADGFEARTIALEAPSGTIARVELPGPLAVFSRRALDRTLWDAAAAA